MEYKYEHHHPINNDGIIRCCCGQPECAFLRENQLALEAVEKDLETAARLGQVRHFFNYSRPFGWKLLVLSFCIT
ncbi:uncharacterized protein EURHEDRAFT_412780 [Aspergillus ruber CBS 135680]|uniref:Uncharacterized protein n=1 Tax=Aspergillus ruber (strain CBS 135680) TaxID=1388766 RepID=A0A017SFA0_ASPRC|nr:uncharacterized protein EURHEDRAFT_412780 [Aspergillus ruber CBS 135680]EYE94930.1 hypothetical protein EURHEDRAFT_412780 [Aspergillus ruber CBS 135680]